MLRRHPAVWLALSALWLPVMAGAQPPVLRPAARAPIRGAHYPALSPDGRTLAFEYQGDLWTVPSDGGNATRLTVHPAYDAFPRWSPDGRWIAFSSNREGNMDLYLIPARGGEARQVTYHSADDIVQDWSPDGTQLLFNTAREGRFADLYLLSLKDNRLRRLTADRTMARYAVFTPDGKTVIYARGAQAWWRPKYRGSQNADLWAVPSAGGKARRLTDYEGWDSFPLCAPDGQTLYYVTQRDGASNLQRMRLPDGKPEPVTRFTSGAVRYPTLSRDGSRLAFEYDFGLWVVKTGGGGRVSGRGGDSELGTRNSALSHDSRLNTHDSGFSPSLLTIYAPGDLLANQTQRIALNAGATSLALSPDGKTLAFAARGEVWTVPAEGGDAARMTQTGAAEYSPVWSPDGKTLAYMTDRQGSLDIYVMDARTKAETPVASDASDETGPKYAPTGRALAWVRDGGSEPGLYVLPLPPNAPLQPAQAVRVGPGPDVSAFDWSPDGKWLAYAKRDTLGTTDLWVVPSVGGTPVNITRYPGVNTNPQWSRDGRHIIFLSSRGSGPGAFSAGLYALRLVPEPPEGARGRGDEGARGRGDDRVTGWQGDRVTGQDGDSALSPQPSALPHDSTLTTHDFAFPGPESQRRRPPTAPPGPTAAPAGPPPGLPATPVPPLAANVVIEFDDIQNRARPVTTTREPIGSATLSPDARTVVYTMASGGPPDWWATDLASGATARLTTGGEAGSDVEFAPDASKFYFRAANGTIRQLARNTPASTPVAFSANLTLDRRVEVAEAFNEAWRSLRTGFYDPKMHGADWNALRARYEPLLAETVAKEDFAWLLSAMIGELNASHLGATPPAAPGPTTTTGYLGLTFDPDYAGPGLKVTGRLKKGPADQTGRRIEPGEYVLTIDGAEVALNEDLYRALRDKAGRDVDLLVVSSPPPAPLPKGGPGAVPGVRTVKVRPMTKAQEDDLEYEEWVEARRRKVDALSGGRLAYLHIRSMDQPSLQRFQREIYGDAQSKQGAIIDVRFNGGGRISAELLDILARRPNLFRIPRDGERSLQPAQVWNRPLVVLTNEYSASDSEIFPNGVRELGLGKVVGETTAGAVIGTSDITLVDGTRFRVPATGAYRLDGTNLENYGVRPDVRVEMTPEDNATDNDRQLEAAVKLLLAEIK